MPTPGETVTHLKVVINGQVRMDSDSGQWTDTPPELVKELLANHLQPEPWSQALLTVVARAAATQTDTTAEITSTPKSWTLNVTHT